MSELKHVFSVPHGNASLKTSDSTKSTVETDGNNGRAEVKHDLGNDSTCQNIQIDPKNTKYASVDENDNNNNAAAAAAAATPGTDHVRTSVNIWDILCIILSVLSFLYDYVIDIYTMKNYFSTSPKSYGLLTLVFVIIPGVIRTLISNHMRQQDKTNVKSQEKQIEKTLFEKIVDRDPCIILLVLSLFKLSPCLYHLRCLCYALMVRSYSLQPDTHGMSHYYPKFLKEQEDAALLSIVGCSLEAAPQLILQLHILWMEGLKITTTWYKIAGSCITLIVLGWSSKSYHCNIRMAQHDKAIVTRTGGVFLFLWLLGMTISRISLTLIALRMSVLYTLLACMLIWIGWTAWIYKKKYGVLEFCRGKTIGPLTKITVKERIGTLFFSAVLSVVYFFMYVNLTENPTARRYLFYYILWVLEIVTVIVLWFSYENLAIERDWYSLAIPILSVVSFFIGIACMMIYYQFLHPTLNKIKSTTSVTRTVN